MSSSRSKDPLFITAKGTALHVNSIWAWKNNPEEGNTWYFRFLNIQDGAGGLHAIVYTQEGRTVGAGLHMFDHPDMREVMDEDELGFAMLVLV